GLLGSEAYTRDPLVPLEQTAAVINLDVTNVRGATRDIDALGVDRSTLGAVFDAAARAESLTVVHEPDVRGSFYRSDHFPFSKAGVPALSIEPGRDFVGRPAGWGEQEATRYNRERYHQPGHEYRPTFTYAGMAQEVRVAMQAARAVANAPARPRARPSSIEPMPRSCRRPSGIPHASRRCANRCCTTSRRRPSLASRRRRDCGAGTCSRPRRPRGTAGPSLARSFSIGGCSSWG